MTKHLTEHEIFDLAERLRQRPEMQVAILEERIAKAKAILKAAYRYEPNTSDTMAMMEAIQALEGK